ncbi:MAG: hypothetical protein ACRETC_07725, partial [Gammaproteobacteria bacterium]
MAPSVAQVQQKADYTTFHKTDYTLIRMRPKVIAMQRMMQDTRFVLAVAGSGFITLGLFLLMHQLIANHQSDVYAHSKPLSIDLVKVQKQPVTSTTQTKPKPQPKLLKRPSTSTPTTAVTSKLLPPSLNLPAGPGNFSIIGTPNAGANTGAGGYSGLQVRFRTPPLYPPQAAYQGAEGNVRTCFT